MTLAISVATPELALVASSTRASRGAGVTREWMGPHEDRIGEFSNVRRVGGGPTRGGWATAFGAPMSWCSDVFHALEGEHADDVDGMAGAIMTVTEEFANTVLGGVIIPPGEEHPERWPGGVQMIHAAPWGFGRATIYGNGEVWGREYFVAYAPPLELGAAGLPIELRAAFERTIVEDRTVPAVLRATAALFHRAYELTNAEAGSVGQLVEVGLLRKEITGDRWRLRYEYLRPTRAMIIEDALDRDLSSLVVSVDPLPTLEVTC